MTDGVTWVSKALTIENPQGLPPEDVLGVRRYLADGWRIAGATTHGSALTVDLVKPAEAGF